MISTSYPEITGRAPWCLTCIIVTWIQLTTIQYGRTRSTRFGYPFIPSSFHIIIFEKLCPLCLWPFRYEAISVCGRWSLWPLCLCPLRLVVVFIRNRRCLGCRFGCHPYVIWFLFAHNDSAGNRVRNAYAYCKLNHLKQNRLHIVHHHIKIAQRKRTRKINIIDCL